MHPFSYARLCMKVQDGPRVIVRYASVFTSPLWRNGTLPPEGQASNWGSMVDLRLCSRAGFASLMQRLVRSSFDECRR